MWTYWLMFLVPATAALLGGDRNAHAVKTRSEAWTLGQMAAAAALAIIIGYRFEVGGDWFSYSAFVESIAGQPLAEIWSLSDPGYSLLNWISSELGWHLVGVNLMGAAIFSVGLVSFCRSLPRPWLALTIAIPYLVIVVAMGYTRQGIALSLTMLGLVALQRDSMIKFVVFVVLGATFHKSAVLLLPVAALATTKNRYWTLIWVGTVSVMAYALLLAESVDGLYEGYVESEYQSEGALVRLLMNAFPAAIYLLLRNRFAFAPAQASLWRWFSLLSVALVGVLLATPASTAVDRIALYMLPLQLVIFSHLPSAIEPRSGNGRAIISLLVVLYYMTVLAVWLFFATHAEFWVPYRFYLFE